MSTCILTGDCRAVLATLPEASVQCCVTSPPYFGLRDYGVDGQIGLEQTPDAYVAELVAVFREVRRVLRDDGCVFLNLGDSYHSTPTSNVPQTKNPKGPFPSSPARVQHAAACDTSDRAPEGFQEHGCLCGSLCDACRRAYRIGITHSDGRRVPKPSASNAASIREHTVSPFGHVPTSGSFLPADHSANATRGQRPYVRPEHEQLHGALASMSAEYVPLLQDECSRCGNCGVALSVPRSTALDAQQCARKSACTCGIGTRSGTSLPGTLGTLSSDLAYPSSTTKSPYKPKDLLGIPWMVAFALRADGWWLRSDIIWHKPNPMPESVRDRPTSAHEHVFLLTKSARYFWDAEAVAEPSKYPDDDRKARSAVTDKRMPTEKIAGIRPGSATYPTRNIRNVWTIASKPYKGAHFATFPPALAERCIKAGTSERGQCPKCGAPWGRVTSRGAEQPKVAPSSLDRYGTGEAGVHRKVGGQYQKWLDANPLVTTGWQPSCACPTHTPVPQTVLDPFAGAGTTGLVAKQLGRRSTLIELNPAYAELACRRIEQAQRRADLFVPAPPLPNLEHEHDLFAAKAAK